MAALAAGRGMAAPPTLGPHFILPVAAWQPLPHWGDALFPAAAGWEAVPPGDRFVLNCGQGTNEAKLH